MRTTFARLMSLLLCLLLVGLALPARVAAEEPQKYTVEQVQAMIDALPTVEALEAMNDEEQQQEYLKIQEAYKAYQSLEPEDQALITGVQKIEELLAYFESAVVTNPDDELALCGDLVVKGNPASYSYSEDENILIVKDGAKLTITSGTGATTRIEVEAGAKAGLTLEGVDLTAPKGHSALNLKHGAYLTLSLAEGFENTLTGGSDENALENGRPGIHLPADTTLYIEGSGSLRVQGGSGHTGGNAIGGDAQSPDKATPAEDGGNLVVLFAPAELLPGESLESGAPAQAFGGGAIPGTSGEPSYAAAQSGFLPAGTAKYQVTGDVHLPEGTTLPAGITLTGTGTVTPRFKAEIQITKNLNKPTDGAPATLTAEDYKVSPEAEATITWYADASGQPGAKLAEAPALPGRYWVKVQILENPFFAGEAQKAFSITPAILTAPADPAWSATTPGTATWSKVEGARAYLVQLLKAGSPAGAPLEVSGADTTAAALADKITEAGRYSFKVKALGDQNHEDSAESVESGALYTVRFNLDGGKGEIPMQLVREGQKAEEPTVKPTKQDHDFLGWRAANASENWNFEQPVEQPLELLAQWKKKSGGGEGGGSGGGTGRPGWSLPVVPGISYRPVPTDEGSGGAETERAEDGATKRDSVPKTNAAQETGATVLALVMLTGCFIGIRKRLKEIQ